MRSYVYYCSVYKAIGYIIITCVIILSVSCKENFDAPCRAVNYQSIMLTDFEKSFVPYNTADTIVFHSLPNGTSADAIISSRNVHWLRTPIAGGNPDCPSDSIQYEVLKHLIRFPLFTVNLALNKKSQALTINSDSNHFHISFAALSSADSINIPSAAWEGKTFTNIYLRTAQADSLYYTKASGIVRYVRGAVGYLMQ